MDESSRNDCLALMHTLMECRQYPINSLLQDVRKRHSMLHMDVLTLIYHFARTTDGDILEIGPYLGGSTIAAALGIRDSGKPRTFISIEHGGKCVHPRLPSRNIIKDLKKNLAKRNVSSLVTLLEGNSGNKLITSAVYERLKPRGTSMLIVDADGNVARDIALYRDLLVEGCWLVIDDYFMLGSEGKAQKVRPAVEALASTGEFETLGFYGWGTWIGRWHNRPAQGPQ